MNGFLSIYTKGPDRLQCTSPRTIRDNVIGYERERALCHAMYMGQVIASIDIRKVAKLGNCKTILQIPENGP